MKRFSMAATALGAALLTFGAASPAQAEITQAGPGGFSIRVEETVSGNVDEAWAAMLHPETWWSGEHSYSGDADNFTFEPRAGGCFCESWDGGSVEHGRVLMVLHNPGGTQMLRIAGALGPLQDMGVTAVLTLTAEPDPNGAKLSLAYRVTGEPEQRLDVIAPAVDGVLMEQLGRLTHYISTGAPD